MKRIFTILGSLSLLFFASCGKVSTEVDTNANSRIGSAFTDPLLFGQDGGGVVGLSANQAAGVNPQGYLGSYGYSYNGSSPYGYSYNGNSYGSNTTNWAQAFDPYTGSSNNPYTGSGYMPYSSASYGPMSLPYNSNLISAYDPYNVANRYQTDPYMGAFLGFAGWVHTLAPNILSVVRVGLISPAGTPGFDPFAVAIQCPTGYTYNGSACVLNGSSISPAVGSSCGNWNLVVRANQTLRHLRRSQFSNDSGIVQRLDQNSFQITWQSQGKPQSGFIFAIQGQGSLYQGCDPYSSPYVSCPMSQVPLQLSVTGTVTDCNGATAQVNMTLDQLVNNTSGTAPFVQQTIAPTADSIKVRAANFQGQQSGWFQF